MSQEGKVKSVLSGDTLILQNKAKQERKWIRNERDRERTAFLWTDRCHGTGFDLTDTLILQIRAFMLML
jgi:hypothetical protein